MQSSRASTALSPAAAMTAAHAIGRLDGAVASSSVAAVWRERATIAGLADCVRLAGVSLTPADFFRMLVGLKREGGDTTIDYSLLLGAVAAALAQLGPASTTRQLIDGLMRAYGSSAQDIDWPLGKVDTAATVAALSLGAADVGTALLTLGDRIAAARSATAMPAWTPAVLCTVAAVMPGALMAAGITAGPLPCLTGLQRSKVLYADDNDALGQAVLWNLGTQAEAGLVLLHRLEACAAAWQARLPGRTTRSRAGVAAALFLVWPALTRRQVAQALGVSLPGAGSILKTLVACDILVEERVGVTRFYVAPESLADFKLVPRQGRHRAPPHLPGDRSGLTGLAADVDAALADLDRLIPRLPDTATADHDDRTGGAYQDQPSGRSPG